MVICREPTSEKGILLKGQKKKKQKKTIKTMAFILTQLFGHWQIQWSHKSKEHLSQWPFERINLIQTFSFNVKNPRAKVTSRTKVKIMCLILMFYSHYHITQQKLVYPLSCFYSHLGLKFYISNVFQNPGREWNRRARSIVLCPCLFCDLKRTEYTSHSHSNIDNLQILNKKVNIYIYIYISLHVQKLAINTSK